ncbi:hypothetical protein DAMA08_020900 (mitochondrion) [Martiniozyma asiatica (nom. inval.)]|nr:hypothetical protein DAMA08_020900 [Martiniozyma asiatica]
MDIFMTKGHFLTYNETAFDSNTPDNPPTVKMKMNATPYNMAAVNTIDPPYKVARDTIYNHFRFS